LEKWVTLEKEGFTLGKRDHKWVILGKRVTLGKMGRKEKKGITLGKKDPT